MTPEQVINPLRKQFQIPDSVARLLYLLLLYEIQHDYPSIQRASYIQLDTSELAIPYATALAYIFEKLPKIRDIDNGAFYAPIKQLAGLTQADYYSLLNQNPYQFKLHQIADKFYKDLEGDQILTTYLKDTLWGKLLNFNVSFDLKEKRVHHTHVLGASGSGKSVLLQHMILQDIEADSSVIFMAPKGKILKNIAYLRKLPPKRLVFFSPETPIPLNIFELGDNAIGLINYIFAGIFEADLTGKQTPLLNHSIRLLMKKKGTHIRDLRNLMKSTHVPEEYKDYLPLLTQSGQEFFAERFHQPDMKPVKELQIMWRLDQLIENPFFERLFCQPESKLNLREIIDEGKVLVIDTSEDKLDAHGSSFLGRLFLQLVLRESQQRKDATRDAYLFVDEIGSYITPNIGTILEKAREARIAFTLAHQQLSQLTGVEDAVMTNTETKIVGRCSEKDARKLESAMLVPWEQLMRQKQFNWTFNLPDSEHSLQTKVTPKHSDTQSRYREKEFLNVWQDNQRSSPRNIDVFPGNEKVEQVETKYTPPPKTKPPHDW